MQQCGDGKTCDTCVEPINKKVCKKCREKAPVILIQADPTCLDCFKAFVEHSFKMSLRMKCSVTAKGERILLCISYGQNSATMAKLFSDVIHMTGHYNRSKMFIEAEVLHIDESFVWSSFGHDSARLAQQEAKLRTYIEDHCKLKYHVVKVESLYDNPAKLLNLLQVLPEDGSAREDMLKYIKQHIILQFASRETYNKIAYASNGQMMVSTVFSSLAKGRGMNLNSDIGYQFDIQYRNKNFTFIRPIRDILTKSVLFHVHIYKPDLDFNLEQHLKFTTTKHKPAQGNIDHLLNDFINKLQTGFTSTVTTVLQTASKAKLKDPAGPGRCPICMAVQEHTMNKLEIETLDHSTQEEMKQLQQTTLFYKHICLACKRVILGSSKAAELFNLSEDYFPQCFKEL